MKKTLLTLAIAQAVAFGAFAQRMTLHEEFTGENCGPCAATNPNFWTLCDLTANASKLIHISYMAPIPSPGWYYDRTSTLEGVRETYYSVPFAPYGRYDGHVPDPTASSPGHPYYFTQSDIDAEYAIPDSFTISATNAWNSTYDSVITTVTVHCVTAWSGGSSIYLRAALVETNNFATSPGSNGETHFENVVQAMYPDAMGTSITGTWAAGATQVYTITGAAPSFLDYSGAPYMVVWIQNDANKVISQAAKATTPLPPIPNDAAITGTTVPNLVCNADGSYTLAHSVTIKNDGNNTLTSATIYYSVDGGTLMSTPWSGSIAVGGNTSFAMPTNTVTVAGPGYHSVYDSVAMPNGSTDQDPGNNAYSSMYFIESTTAGSMPYTTSFEGTDYAVHYASDNASDNQTWGIWYNSTTPLGHTSVSAARYPNYNAHVGTANIFTLPEVTTSAASAISFWVAYAQLAGTENDKLEVVYSTDCGSTWTSIWSSMGSALATVPHDDTTYFWPSSPSQYVEHAASLSTVPTNSLLAFRATSAGGNYLWLDDINIHTTVAVNNVTETSLSATVYPNPTKDEATLSFNLAGKQQINVQIVDGLGRTMNSIADETMEAGLHTISINTQNLATGVYNIMIHTDNGTFTKRLNVVK